MYWTFLCVVVKGFPSIFVQAHVISVNVLVHILGEISEGPRA